MSGIAGRSLELAIGRASKRYRAGGRKCVMVRQHTPFTVVDGRRIYDTVGAPCDFLGAVDKVPFAAEAKETQHARFPLDRRRIKQWSALSLLAENGYEVRLIVDFYSLGKEGETYTVPWTAVQEFMRAPCRKSLPIYWFRAFGELVLESNRETDHRVTHFLDSKPHDEREMSYLAWAAERAKKAGVIVSFDDDSDDDAVDEIVPQSKSPAAELHRADPEAYRRRIRGFAEDGIAHVMGSKKKTFGRRGRG